MKLNVAEFIQKIKLNAQTSKPIFLNVESQDEMNHLVDEIGHYNITYHSVIDYQIEEIKEIYTKMYSFSDENFNQFVGSLVCDKTGIMGELVYFGWGDKVLINTFGDTHFYELITWRNKNKITQEEQQILSAARVGVVGNSVGSFALRVLSKLGIKNFNIAEIKDMKPSNAPRLYHDSVRDYGLHKSIPLIKGLYEFNPFINLNVFCEGINKHNVDRFFIQGEGIHILIDAADDGVTKLLLREYCEKYKIPLVSGFDERGALVVIRYDQENNLEGKELPCSVEDLIELKNTNPREYINKLLDFFPGGEDNISVRQKLTIKEIQNDKLGGFSQLSWEASLFASCVAKVTSDIILGKQVSGNFLVDLDEIIK